MKRYALVLATVSMAGSMLAMPDWSQLENKLPPPPPPPPTLPPLDFWDQPGFLPHEFDRLKFTDSTVNKPEFHEAIVPSLTALNSETADHTVNQNSSPLPTVWAPGTSENDWFKCLESVIYWSTTAAINSILRNLPLLRNEPPNIIEPKVDLQTMAPKSDHESTVTPIEVTENSEIPDHDVEVYETEDEEGTESTLKEESNSKYEKNEESDVANKFDEKDYDYDEGDTVGEEKEYSELQNETQPEENKKQSDNLIDEETVNDNLKKVPVLPLSETMQHQKLPVIKNITEDKLDKNVENHEESKSVLQNSIDNKKIVNLLIFYPNTGFSPDNTQFKIENIEPSALSIDIRSTRTEKVQGPSEKRTTEQIETETSIKNLKDSFKESVKTDKDLTEISHGPLEEIKDFQVRTNIRTLDTNIITGNSFEAEYSPALKTNRVINSPEFENKENDTSSTVEKLNENGGLQSVQNNLKIESGEPKYIPTVIAGIKVESNGTKNVTVLDNLDLSKNDSGKTLSTDSLSKTTNDKDQDRKETYDKVAESTVIIDKSIVTATSDSANTGLNISAEVKPITSENQESQNIKEGLADKIGTSIVGENKTAAMVQ